MTMTIERIRPMTYQLALHVYEPATLVAAARLAAEAGKGSIRTLRR